MSAQAAIVVTGESSGTSLAFANQGSSTDLINAGQATLSGVTYGGAASMDIFAEEGLNDGVFNNDYGPTSGSTFYNTVGATSSATYDLDVSVNTSGYDIASIQTFMGWSNPGMADQVSYTVEVSTVGSADYTFLTPVPVNYPWETTPGGVYESHVAITENSTGLLASNVDSIRFTFTPAAQMLVREIDVHAIPGTLPAVTITGGSYNPPLPYSTGWKFQPSEEITVTALGVYDSNGGGLANDYTVQVYNVTADSIITNVLVSSATPGQAAGDKLAHYVDIPPLTLAAGQTYLIAMNQGSDGYMYDSTITSDPRIGYMTGVAADGGLPASPSGFTIIRTSSYFGPNFKYEPLEEIVTFGIAQPLTHAVYQRNSNNVAQVTITGTIGSGVDRVEGRAVPRAGFKGTPLDWTELPDIGDGLYSNTVALAGGWYDIEVRTLNAGIPVSTSRVERVGSGEIFITCGQSNSASYGLPKQSPADERISALDYVTGIWAVANDPQPRAGTASWGGGSPWPDFGDLLARRTDTPVGVIAIGVGSTRVEQWISQFYGKLTGAINALQPYGGFRAILWHQGESDSIAATDATTYASRLTTVIDQSRADTGFTVPWGVALASYHPDSSAANEANIIAGQMSVISNSIAVFKGAETDSFHTKGWLSDLVHFNDLGLRDHGRQWVDAVCASLLADDRDGDEMPDLWMLMHFGHAEGQTNDFSSATDDADLDGANNLQEYQMSTDPNDPASVLRVTDMVISNDTATLTFPTIPGRTYLAEWTDNLVSNNWINNGAAHVYEESLVFENDIQSEDHRFYRVKILGVQ